MPSRIAINGFGRIGRAVFKNIIRNYSDEMEIVAINDLTDSETLVHLLRYDSVYGMYEEELLMDDGFLLVGERGEDSKIKLFSEKDPLGLPWEDLDIDIVLECTGLFTDHEGAKKHLDAGAKKVIISAPSKDPEKVPSFVMGVNEKSYDSGSDDIVDMGSCTTNCLAPILKIIHDNFGVERGMMTTIHSYTANQNLLDGPHKDKRRARAAAENIIPTTTGAARAIGRVLPELEGKVEGMAIRVPTPTVSVIDLVCRLKESVTEEDLKNIFKGESEKEGLRGILGVEDAPLVSSDYIGSNFSSVVDSELVSSNEKMAKIFAWYDNEWGYSARLADFAYYISKEL